MARRARPVISPEGYVHRAVVAHVNARAVPGLLCWHTPNGGRRSPREAKSLQRMGVRAGVPDLLFFRQGIFYALELKSDYGKASQYQLEFISAVNREGGFAAVAQGLTAALKILEAWGLIR